MSISTVACYNFAANTPRRSARKAGPRNFFGGVAIAGLVLGCGWTVYANIFAASPYPQLSGANFDAPVIRRPQTVASVQPVDSVTRIAEMKPAPAMAAPATVPAGPSLSFSDRFAAAAPQGIEPAPQPEAPKLAEASLPASAPKSASVSRLAEATKQPQPLKLAEVSKASE